MNNLICELCGNEMQNKGDVYETSCCEDAQAEFEAHCKEMEEEDQYLEDMGWK